MKKVIGILVGAVIVAVFVLPAYAAGRLGNPPDDGFRGHAWKSSPEELGIEVIEVKPMHLYVGALDDEKLSIGEAELTGIVYTFYNDELFNVRINYDGTVNHFKLLEAFEAHHSKAYQENKYIKEYSWRTFSGKYTLFMKYDQFEKKGYAFYDYKPVRKQYNKAMKKLAKEASSDF